MFNFLLASLFGFSIPSPLTSAGYFVDPEKKPESRFNKFASVAE
jgi:hypothetical protein